MDQFAALRAFIAVADHAGFAPAARRLGVATSSLTRQVDGLEARLGAPLLNRSTRSVTLTDAGARYLDDARRILDELAEADRGVREIDGPPTGLVRLSVPIAFARLHIAPILPPLLARYPELGVDLVATDSVVNLVEERIDVAIRLGPLASSRLVARKLAPHRRVLAASPAYLEAHGEPAAPHELAHHRCLLFGYETHTDTWHLRRAEETVEARVVGPLRSTSSEVLRRAALDGAGILMMPTWLIGLDIKSGRLRQVLRDWQPSPDGADGTIAAVYLANRRGSRKVKCILDALADYIGTPPRWERP